MNINSSVVFHDQTLKLHLTDEKRFRPCHYRLKIFRASQSYKQVEFENPLNKCETEEVIFISGDSATAVNTSSAVVEGVVTTRAVRTLPLNGRNFLELALLIPGN